MLIVLLSWPLCGMVGAATRLPEPIRQALKAHRVSAGEIGLLVAAVDDGKPLLTHQPRRRFNPASTMKVLTSYAALSMLGAQYRWTTRFEISGALDAGTLNGDLIVRGGGDPKLVIEDLTEIVTRIRATGLRNIEGDLLLDDSMYRSSGASVDSFDEDPSQPYNVLPNAAMMNFKSTKFVVKPDGTAAQVELVPPLAGIELANLISVTDGPCRYGASALSVRDAGADRNDPGRITLAGRYSAACGTQATYSSVLTHRQFVEALFRAAWTAVGGQWRGHAKRLAAGAQIGPTATLLDWQSPHDLAQVVRDLNKFSNNVMTRQLLLHSAVVATGKPAGIEQARDQLRRWLSMQGLRLNDVTVENGSGLSRRERFSAASMVTLLRHIARSANADQLRESLPVVGVDGSMGHRLRGDPIAGRAWIKTGSLQDVRAIAGYVDARSGKRYAVVMFVNSRNAEAAQPAQDELLRWVHNHG